MTKTHVQTHSQESSRPNLVARKVIDSTRIPGVWCAADTTRG
jgi:hypothetical protein